jgi:hypothetical protein
MRRIEKMNATANDRTDTDLETIELQLEDIQNTFGASWEW